MNKNGLTLTVVVDAESANYGEGIGNISQLKKLTRADGKVYSYISRQAIRYNIVQQMHCDNTPVEDQGVAQFAAASIDFATLIVLSLLNIMQFAEKPE